MGGFSDAVERDILDGVFTGWDGYESLWLALSSTTVNDDGTGLTEPSGGSYVRVETTAADWAAATETSPAIKANSTAITFPQASADWASGSDLTHFALMDAATDGNLVASGTITTPKPILSGDIASFDVGGLRLRLGDPGDFS